MDEGWHEEGFPEQLFHAWARWELCCGSVAAFNIGLNIKIGNMCVPYICSLQKFQKPSRRKPQIPREAMSIGFWLCSGVRH